MKRTIQITTNDITKVSQSGNTISEILNSIYYQNNIKPEHIKDGVIDATGCTWVEIETDKLKMKIEINESKEVR